ncbi:MAG: CDP-glucose 4,6-dehydratase [Deltaproteobacteria bacterium]|nr:CDP-glucose 4,6-dehydratase [Deltaproteobacteria bacterium]
MFADYFQGRKVLVTGHTGFKGGWLLAWLKLLGAEIVGLALPPEGEGLFGDLEREDFFYSHMGDIRDKELVGEVFQEHQPEVVFHMAAQSLVRRGYRIPAETYETNVMGTVNVLEAVRQTGSVRVVVNVTSDKCYENREWEFGYRENDAMGGYDPYSSSKGCAELVAQAYERSFFSAPDSSAGTTGGGHPAKIASARSGNVIGGGDWAEDRIVPDCFRALRQGQDIQVRNPPAVRPWQHVLEPLSGYLWLAASMGAGKIDHRGGWNFGPGTDANKSVGHVVELLLGHWGRGEWRDGSGGVQPHEAGLLQLNCSKAAGLLGWNPVFSLPEAVRVTVDWYRASLAGGDFRCLEFTTGQIEDYQNRAREKEMPWAV